MIFSIKEIKLSDLPSYSFNGTERRISLAFLFDWDAKPIIYDMKSLENSIKKEGYNPEKYGYITAIPYLFSNKYWVMDGKHRLDALKKIYNKNHKIKVKSC